MKRYRRKPNPAIPPIMSTPLYLPFGSLPCVPYETYQAQLRAYYDRQIERFNKTDQAFFRDEIVAMLEALRDAE